MPNHRKRLSSHSPPPHSCSHRQIRPPTSQVTRSFRSSLFRSLKGRAFICKRPSSPTDAVYGVERNPFQNAHVQNSFWAIDDDFALLGLGILPGITAPKGTKGRKRFFEAFQEYYQSAGHLSASKVCRARYEVNRAAGIATVDIARFDLAVCYGMLVNTVPGASWALFYLFSDPMMLKAVRDTVMSVNEASPKPESSPGHRRLNIAAVVAHCPLLSSLVREMLRFQSTNAAARIVLRDTTLDGRYLLKKDTLLLIPSEDVHNNESVWGLTAKSFDPRRFLDENKGVTKAPASAYRAFGSGDSVCPGRFLATNEILSIMVIMAVTYDAIPATRDWEAPRSVPHITKSLLTPVGDIAVKLKNRLAVDEIKWDFYWDALEASSKAGHNGL